MARTYYKLEDDLLVEGRWYLNGLYDSIGTQLDSREFQYGKPIDLGPPITAKTWKEGIPVAAQPPLRILLDPKRNGFPLDFTYTNGNAPVATSRVSELLAAIADGDIQRVPVRIESQERTYEIINVVSLVDGIDRKRSEIQWFEEGNSIRPDLAGEPEMITRLVVDPDRVGGRHIFRLRTWTISVIVSDVVKMSLEDMNVSGVKFSQVS